MKAAVEQVFNGSLPVATGGYDATKINVGPRCGQYNLGSGPNDKFAGPGPTASMSFGESSLAMISSFVHPIKVAPDLWWVFGNDNATAAATRRVQLWTWVPSTGVTTFVGAVTLTLPTATNFTSRGLRAILTNVTTGTVAVSGTAVTGTGTAFTTGISVGSRIGFGSTDPNAITTWYEISATGSATSITLTASAGTIAAGTPYVIQDLMIVQAMTNATTTNGGLFVTKGLRYENFQPSPTAIPAATTVDRIRATYWLKDAATVTNTAAGGCAIDDPVSMTEQYAFVCDGASTTLRLFRYNFRAPLTGLASGAQVLTGSDIVITGTQTVTGTIQQINNGRVAALGHGPGSGVKCVYLVTSSRILRIPLASITGGSTTFVADAMTEAVPGGAATNIAAGAFATFDVASSLDRLMVATSASAGTAYVTQYNAAGAAHERRMGAATNQNSSNLRDLDLPAYPHFLGTVGLPSVWVEEGWLFWVNMSSATTQNQCFIYPLAADWLYVGTTGDRVIAPKITLGASASKLYRVLINCAENLGDETMGVAPDAYRVLYRTSGIDDNSGAWTVLGPDGNLSGAGAPADIQFAFEFRTMGTVMITARILSLALLYETADALPSQYRWNFADFNTANGTFAWVQTALFGAAPGVHTINIYRADTNALVLTQGSGSTTNGTFENWNGSAWVAGLGADTVGRRRRFVPSGSLPGSVDLYAAIQVA